MTANKNYPDEERRVISNGLVHWATRDSGDAVAIRSVLGENLLGQAAAHLPPPVR